MESVSLLDRAGRRRSPAILSSFHQGLPPRNKGLRYPPDPPTVQEIVAVMAAAGDSPEGIRLRGVIVVLWRAGLRITEALSLAETDLDQDRGALVVRHGKGDKRREVGMDRWGWTHLALWLELRRPCRSVHCSACCAARPAVARARRQESAASSIAPLRLRASAAGSRHTSSGTRMPSRCLARGSRCW
jgi:site-specific recombinase XerC